MLNNRLKSLFSEEIKAKTTKRFTVLTKKQLNSLKGGTDETRAASPSAADRAVSPGKAVSPGAAVSPGVVVSPGRDTRAVAPVSPGR